MTPHEAARLINENVSYRPNCQIEAVSSGLRYSEGIKVYVRMIVQDSDKKNAPYYREQIQGGGEFFVPVYPEMTEQDLYRQFFNRVIAEIEMHEAREFFKVGSDFVAPFHPHTEDGEDRWRGRQIPIEYKPGKTRDVGRYLDFYPENNRVDHKSLQEIMEILGDFGL